MPDPTEGVYEGSSIEEEPDLDPALKHALVNAYKKGMAAKPEADRKHADGSDKTFIFKVEAIFVEGTNPPSDYRVVVKDDGHK